MALNSVLKKQTDRDNLEVQKQVSPQLETEQYFVLFRAALANTYSQKSRQGSKGLYHLSKRINLMSPTVGSRSLCNLISHVEIGGRSKDGFQLISKTEILDGHIRESPLCKRCLRVLQEW